jgi:hypothetical protein
MCAANAHIRPWNGVQSIEQKPGAKKRICQVLFVAQRAAQRIAAINGGGEQVGAGVETALIVELDRADANRCPDILDHEVVEIRAGLEARQAGPIGDKRLFMSMLSQNNARDDFERHGWMSALNRDAIEMSWRDLFPEAFERV